MNKIINVVKLVYEPKYLPFVVLTCAMLLLHSFANFATDDYVFFKNASELDGYINVLRNMLLTWMSAPITLAIGFIFLKAPIVVWILCDTFMIVLMATCLSKLLWAMFPDSDKKILNWTIVVFFFLYPLYDMSTAGWVMTTTVYIFPLACTVLACMFLKKVYFGERVALIEYIIYFAANMLASNSLQAIFVLLVLYAMFIADRIFSKLKMHPFLVIQWFGSFVWLVYHLISPANTLRFYGELHWWPSVYMYDIVQKIKLGAAATTSNFVQNPNAIFTVFCVLILLCVWYKYADNFYRFIAVIPLVLATTNIFGPIVFYKFFPFMEGALTFKTDVTIMGDSALDIVIPLTQSNSLQFYLPFIVQLFVFMLIPVLLYLIFGNTKKTILFIAIYLIGIMTRMELSFSPTLYASSTRTFIYLYGVFIFIGGALFLEFQKLYGMKKAN